MMKTVKDGQDQNEALLELRNTPRQGSNLSPAEIMFGRHTRSMLPEMNLRKSIQREKIAIKKSYDKRSRDLPELEKGQTVFYAHKKGEIWWKGMVYDKLDFRTYLIKNQNGAVYRRNHIHIRPTKVSVHIRDLSPPRMTWSPQTLASTDTNVAIDTSDPVVIVEPSHNELQPEPEKPAVAESATSTCMDTRPKRTRTEPA